MLRLCESAEGVAPVSAARVRLLQEGDLLVAATAWRQLAAEGHAKAGDALDDLVERTGDQPAPPVRAQLLRGVVLLQDDERYPLLLRLAASDAGPVRDAMREVAAAVVKDAALVRWLATEGLDAVDAPAREASLRLLQHASPEALRPLLAKLRERLRSPSKKDLELAIGMAPLFAKDAEWTAEATALANARDPAVRTVGLHVLLELGSKDGLASAQQSASAEEWELRSIAFRYLGRVRDASSVPLLIARVDKESGRLAEELGETLFQLTGTRRARRSDWDEWWNKSKGGFTLPAEAMVRTAKPGSGGRTVAYFGIPLVSKRSAFLIDVSGSMQAITQAGTERRSRIEEAKRQLVRVIEGLESDQSFNVLVYETDVEPMWERLQKASKERRAEAIQKVEELQPRGGTNIFDALETAFRDPDVDTIYLLTDGQPSSGMLLDPDAIADEVKRWNYRRQIVVHGISIGLDSKLLKRLAAESGGTYVYVR
jgi:hypothetical protein